MAIQQLKAEKKASVINNGSGENGYHQRHGWQSACISIEAAIISRKANISGVSMKSNGVAKSWQW